MLSKFTAPALAAALIASTAGVVSAAPGATVHVPALENGRGALVLAAATLKKPGRHAGVGGFKAKSRAVKDTCPANDKACINDLVKNCDKAGGGLSTWPDGSVDCYVVGIHDQP